MRTLGDKGPEVPSVIFGTSCLGNLYQELSYEVKLAIAEKWFQAVDGRVVLDSAGKYGAGMALEMIGKTLRDLGKRSEDVLISDKLGWIRKPMNGPEPTFEPGVWAGLTHDAEQRISYKGIKECWERDCELLGDGFTPGLVSVHDPDEYLEEAADYSDHERRLEDVLGAYQALRELKRDGWVQAVGVGSKDWRVIQEIQRHVELDWVMFACSLTPFRHEKALLGFMDTLFKKGIGMVNSAVFHAGFLVGGKWFDYRLPDPDSDAELFDKRDRIHRVCAKYEVPPAVVCVQFGMSVPGMTATALNTSDPGKVLRNAESTRVDVPSVLWRDLKEVGVVDPNYPYLG